MPKQITLNGDELYKITQNFINYHGQSGTDSKDGKYSVKNIKTIILSPQCLIFEYHLPIGDKPFDGAVKIPIDSRKSAFISNCWMIAFNQTTFSAYVNTMKSNRAIVDAIGRGTNKCQGLEEIILVPSDNGCYLSSRDSDIKQFLEELIANKQSRTGDLVKDLYNYYPRLRCISYASNTNIVIRALRQRDMEQRSGNREFKTLKSYGLFSDFMDINVDGWYKTTSYSANYPLDNKLTEHFEKIKSLFEKEDKDSKLAEIRKQRMGAIEEEWKKASDRYTAYNKCFNGFYKFNEKYGVLAFDIQQVNSVKSNEKPDKDTPEAYKEAVKGFNLAVYRYRMNFYNYLLSCLQSLDKYSLSIVFHDKPSLSFPEGIKEDSRLASYGVRFNAKPNDDAFASAIAFYCEFFTVCESKYREASAWKEKLKYE